MDEKQKSLEELAHHIEQLQHEVDEKAKVNDVLARRVEELNQERDDLRKDIEQLCMQQAGPNFLNVVAGMQSQRTTGLEQEIENLQKKLAGCLRENQNLQEQVAEAYRIKGQLAELHSAEVLKNDHLTKQNEILQKQARFFQSNLAQAFAERDQSLLECEKAKEKEEAVSIQLTGFNERIQECQSAYADQKRLNDTLQMELAKLKLQSESCMKVIMKFYDLRAKEMMCSAEITLEEKCSILLEDSSGNWIYSPDGIFEQERELLKSSIANLQDNVKMGIQLEQHLRRNIQSLEKRKKMYDDLIKDGISALQTFFRRQKEEIVKILEEEKSHLREVIAEVQEKLSKIHTNTEIEATQEEQQCCDTECKDVHINTDVDPTTTSKNADFHIGITCGTSDELEALAQVMREKVDALLQLSQLEQSYLMERDKNQALHKKIEELQRNLFQVKDEKDKAINELAKLNQEQKEHSQDVKRGNSSDIVRSIVSRDGQGMLNSFLKRASLKRWMRKESSRDDHEIWDGNSSTVSDEYSVDFARLKVENATLHESMANMERLTSSIRRLRNSLTKAQDDVKSPSCFEDAYEALNTLLTEANLMKMALGASPLPVSWCVESADAITFESPHDQTDSPKSFRSERVDPISFASLEMVELLILATEFLKDSFIEKNLI